MADSRSGTRRRDILILEDNPGWRDYLRSIVLHIEGVEVHTAENVNEARQSLIHQTPSVAVLDIRMSESRSDDYEGLRVLRTMREFAPETRVAIVTDHLGDRRVSRALDAYRIDCAFRKRDFDSREFGEVIRKLIDAPVAVLERVGTRMAAVASERGEDPLGYMEATLSGYRAGEALVVGNPYTLSVRLALKADAYVHYRNLLGERPFFVVTIYSPSTSIEPSWHQTLVASAEAPSVEAEFKLTPLESSTTEARWIQVCLYHSNHLVHTLRFDVMVH